MVGRHILDLFDANFPAGAFLLDHIRRARIDFKSIVKTPKPWYGMESKIPFLTVEVTNICNSNCRFCAYQYQGGFRSGKGVMSDALFDRVMDDYQRLGGNFVGFTPFSGEPLLDPGLIDKIYKAHSLGMWTGFFTNGIRLNHVDVESLLKSGVNAIAISCSPFERSMYELLYRNHHYDDVLYGIKKLLVARNNLRPDFPISISIRSHVGMRKALAQNDYRRIIAPLLTHEDLKVLVVQSRGYDTWGGQIKPGDMVGMMRLALVPMVKRRPCSWMWGLYVTWNGQVRACSCRFAETEKKNGKDDLYLGDIKESSLGEIWNGEKLKRLRRSFQEKKLPSLCKRCTMYRSC